MSLKVFWGGRGMMIRMKTFIHHRSWRNGTRGKGINDLYWEKEGMQFECWVSVPM